MRTFVYTTEGEHDVMLRVSRNFHYQIVYGAEVRHTDNYDEACKFIGEALMHAARCAINGDPTS